MRSYLKYGLVVFIAQIICLSANAQKASMTLDSSHYLIGDWINLSLDVQIDEQQKISWPLFEQNLGELEILKVGLIDSNKAENTYHQDLQLIAFDTGFFPIPAIKFYLTDKDNQLDSVITDAVLVEITAVPTDTATADIKPIKDILPAKFSWKEAIPWLIGLIIAVLLILSLYFFYQKRKTYATTEVMKVEPKIPAHEWANQKMAELKQKQLWQQEEVKLYYSELTDILRGYIERRWQTPAMESTTEEIKGALSRIDLSSEVRTEIGQMLFLADLVKFAKSKPLASEHDRCAELVDKFVDQTKEKTVADE